jgi:hypothetical protein
MRGYAYTDLENHKNNLVLLDQDDAEIDYSVAQNNHVNGLVMSRLDFDSKIIEVPPIPDSNIRDMLSFKIRSLYPGDPALTQFDYKIFSANKKRYAIIFISKKQVIEEYKSIAGKKSLLLPFTLLKNQLIKYKEQDACFLFWHSDWVELFIIEQGLLTTTTVLKRAKQIRTDFRKIGKILVKQNKDISLISYCAENEQKKIQENFETHLPDNQFKINLFKDFLAHRIKKSDALFAPPSKRQLPPLKKRMAIYAFSTILLCALLYNKCAVNLLEYEKHLEKKKTEFIKLYADITAMQNEISKLEAKLMSLRAKKPVNLYHLFNDLAVVFSDETELLTFILKDDKFQMEGIGPSALTLEERLKKHNSFSQVSLPEFKPEKNSYKERFRMQGVYNAQ